MRHHLGGIELVKSSQYMSLPRALSSYNPFAVLPDADRKLWLDVLQVNEHQQSKQ
jgi:hypothetical protein